MIEEIINLALVIIAFAIGLSYGATFDIESVNKRTESCIDQWWFDPDGIVEAPWWTKEQARVNAESQKMYLRGTCK